MSWIAAMGQVTSVTPGSCNMQHLQTVNQWNVSILRSSKSTKSKQNLRGRFHNVFHANSAKTFGLTRMRYSRLLSSVAIKRIRSHWSHKCQAKHSHIQPFRSWVWVDAILSHKSLCCAFFKVPTWGQPTSHWKNICVSTWNRLWERQGTRRDNLVPPSTTKV